MRRSERIVWALAACAVVAAAGFALFTSLGDRSWQTDEPVYRNAARAYLEFGNFSHNLEHPMLGKYVIGASEALLGTDAWTTRLPSAIATLLAGLFLALLGWSIGRDAASADGASDGGGDATTGNVLRQVRTGALGALAAAATWLLLPHPGPEFDVTRLAYLDAMMAAAIAATLWAGWKWSCTFALRWALVTGLFAGCAIAIKVPALFVAVPLLLLALTGAPELRTRARLASFSFVALAALVVPILTWLPLRGDLPHALRFLAAMQTRAIDQQLVLAGKTYSGAPFWTQGWWQWDDWPTFAVVQVVALVLAGLVLPRRAAAYLLSATLVPAIVFAVGGGRILPHWQVTWQVAMCALVGLVAARLVIGTGGVRRGSLGVVGRLAGVGMLLVVLVHGGQRLQQVGELSPDVTRQLDPWLEVADRPERIIVDLAGARVGRSLSYARVLGPGMRLGMTYHSAAESQHPWVRHDGGTPREMTQRDLERDPLRVGDVMAIVVDRDADTRGIPIPTDLLVTHYVPHDVGPYRVWLNNDLIAPTS